MLVYLDVLPALEGRVVNEVRPIIGMSGTGSGVDWEWREDQ